MSKLVCINACATVTCEAGRKENQLSIASEDITAFQLGLGQYTFLTISYDGHKEVVRYDGSLGSRRFITIERASNAREIPKGAKVSFEIGCEFLADYVCQRVRECAGADEGEGNPYLMTNNNWSGTNNFRKLSIGGVQVTSESVDSFGLLTIDRGVWSSYTSASPNPRYGFLASVSKSNSAGKLYGARLVARGVGTAGGEFYGVQGEASNVQGSEADLIGVHAIVNAQNSSATYDKIGVLIEHRNRALGTSTLPSGIGLDKFNEGSVGIKFLGQIASSDGEKVGWNRGLVFTEGSLGASSSAGAVGIDFLELSNGASMEALILVARARHPSWGPKKLVAWIQRSEGLERFGAVSTAGAGWPGCFRDAG